MQIIESKESVYIRKELTPTGLVWYTNMAAVSLFGDTNMAAMTSRESALFTVSSICYGSRDMTEET